MAEWRVDKHRYSREFVAHGKDFVGAKNISSRMPSSMHAVGSSNNSNNTLTRVKAGGCTAAAADMQCGP
jgi:hypothetical protein